ncbi:MULTISPECIES: DUF3231 family protein [Sediminibacillus]|uniref:DUF3231 family protein n=1 Tax=Sediminibacillus TaxID=482460 RepID=UPI00040173B3|nr:DUF3231 family protein [Sediminibacillus terrae]
MGILSGNPKNQPMHYGEVFGIWSSLAGSKGMIAGYQTMANHTGDRDLKKLIEDMIRTMKQENEEIEELLKNNGIALPPSPPERAKAALEQIPSGAKFNDPEISAAISRDIGQGLVACSQIIAQCIREDIAMMYGQIHMSKAQFGARLLRLNKEKGWLVPPPLHNQNFE